MNEADAERVDELKSEIEAFDDASISNIPFELLEKQGNRTTKLVESSGDVAPIDGKRRWHEFRFKSPFLVTQVIVQTTGYTEFSDFDFVWQTETGKERRTTAQPEGDTLTLSINDICTAVSFRPPTRFFARAQINSVRIEGITRDDVSTALDSLANLEILKQNIIEVADRAVANADRRIQQAVEADNRRAEVEREIGTLKQTAARTKKTVEDLARKKTELIAENGEAARGVEEAQSRHTELQQSTGLLERNRDNLSREILEKETQLKELKSNINLFPTEIVEFVNQGSNNIKLYFWLAAAPIAIIVIMFVMLVDGAANLTTVITHQSNVNLQALVLSRLPYVAVALGIITASYKIARAFFNEMIRINSQRLNLTKVSIIAKDVSSAAEHDLRLSEEDVYRLRTELKMTLLKDHLKDYISKDFKVELPKRIVGNITLTDDNEPEATA